MSKKNQNKQKKKQTTKKKKTLHKTKISLLNNNLVNDSYLQNT